MNDAEKELRKHLGGANLLTATMKREMCRTARRTAWLLQWNRKGMKVFYSCCGKVDTNEKKPLRAQGEISHRKMGDCPFCKARVEYLDCNRVRYSDMQENWHIWYRRSKLEPETLMVIGAWCGVHLYEMKGVKPELREEKARELVPEIRVCEAALLRWGGGVQSWSANLPLRWSGWNNRYVDNWYYHGELHKSNSGGTKIRTMAKDINGAGWRVEHFDSFDDAIKGTRWEKICRALDVGYSLDTIFRLGVIAKRPQIEYMLVGGLKKLASEALRNGSGASVNWRAKRPERLLPMLDSNERARLRGMPPERVNVRGLELMRLAKLHGQRLKLEDAMRLGEECGPVFYQDTKHILAGDGGKRWGVAKVVRYWRRQYKAGLYGVGRLWEDHLRALRELDCEETEANVFPKDLREAHRDMIKRLKIRKDEEMERMLKERAEKVSDRFSFAACGLVLEPYRSAEEIIKDGSKLDICIASNGIGYMRKYAEGQIILASLRREDRPEESFHACEFSTDGRLIQCRGYGNATFEEDAEQVLAFWAAYNKEKKANVKAILTIERRRTA